MIHLHSLESFDECVVWMMSRLMNTPMVFTGHSHQMETMLRPGSKARLNGSCRGSETLKPSVFVAFTRFQVNLYGALGAASVCTIPHGINSAVFDIPVDYNVAKKYEMMDGNVLCVATLNLERGKIF